jgi:hypothetical protein
MNASNNPSQQNAVTSNDPHRLNNPSAQLAHLALKNRVWNNTTVASSGALDLSDTVIQETLTQVGFAWCAGFLDGEGCVSLARVIRTCGNRVNYRARVNIVQNCAETLKTFRDYVGENCVYAQLPHRESYSRPIYQLIYDGIHAYHLLQKLRPYLVRKGHEADVIFEFFRVGEPSRHFGRKGAPAEIWHARKCCYDALRCLK